MGLRKLLLEEGATSYMYSRTYKFEDREDEVKIIILKKKNSYTLKLSATGDNLLNWSEKVQKTPQEYLSLFIKAVDSTTSPGAVDGQQNNKEDKFEIQQDHLVWKQYFPEQKVHGKLGKFKLEKVEYEAAVSEVLTGLMQQLEDSAKCINKFNKEAQEKFKKLEEAVALAAKSVTLKEEFEKEIYSKCSTLINAKKLKIRQLKSHYPDSSAAAAAQPCSSTRTAEDPGPSARPSKKAKVDHNSSDGYSSDTDVDDPDDQDLDTDDEDLLSLSPSKQRRKDTAKSQGAPSKTPVQALDSQELFNDSLDAELYPSGSTNTKQKFPPSKTSADRQNGHQPQTSTARKGKTPKSPNSAVKSQEPQKGESSTSAVSVPYDSQKSIIEEFF